MNKQGTAKNSTELQKSHRLRLENQTCVYQNKLKQGALVHFEELLVPDGNVVRPLLLVFVVLGRWGVVFVVGAPLDHLQVTRLEHKRKHHCGVGGVQLHNNRLPVFQKENMD